jgi:beta-lactamase class A
LVLRVARFAAAIGLVGAGATAGWAVSNRRLPSGEAEQGLLEGVSWTSPYIEAAGVRDGSPRLVGFRMDMERYISDLRERDPSLGVSLYVRDLEHGAWTGVGEDDPYVPASLMKVTVLFHALSRLEDDPALADARLRYPGPDSMPSPDNLAGAPVPIHMVPGESYSFLDLLDRMVRHSDNHAKDLLLQGVGSGEVDSLMIRIGVPARFDEGQAVMTPRAYATLFRILYESSVFSRGTSEFGLELLAQADFDRGLRAGLPAEMPIASKYGIYFDPRNLKSGQQLHECGIIYPPDHPFVICVMTRSLLKAPSQLAEILSEVARRAYLSLPEPAHVEVPGRDGG